MSTIFEATRHDSVGQVSHYINSGVDVNGEDWSGDTPLIIACRDGFAGIAKVLMSVGADVNKVNKTGDSALHEATQYGHNDCVELLLGEEGIKIDFKNESGDTALHIACRTGNEEVATALVAKGADVYSRNKEGLLLGNTPLDLAANHIYIKRMLIERITKDHQIRG